MTVFSRVSQFAREFVESRRSTRYARQTQGSASSESSRSTKSSITSRLASLKSKLFSFRSRGKVFDNSVDMGAAPASPKLGRSSSRVSFADGDEFSEDGDYSEGYESEGVVLDEPPVPDMHEPEEGELFEALSDAGSVDLMDLVHEVHPQILQMPREQLVMERAIKSKLHPMRKFNMALMRGPERVVKPNHGPRPIPRLLVVAGHTSSKRVPVGNRNINGIYEKMPGLFNGRPWYRKTVQRMPDEVTDPAMGPVSRKLPRVPGYTNPLGINAGDFEEPSIAQVGPAKDQMPKSLYFDDRHGQWKIGTNPKDPKCFARCSDPGAIVPHRLRNWQVWEPGGDWYFHPSMYCERGGG